MVDLIVPIAGAAGRLAGQLIGPRLVSAVLGPAEARALQSAVQAALQSAIEEHLDPVTDQARSEDMVRHLESVLGRIFSQPDVADHMIDAALRRVEPVVGDVMRILEAQGIAAETLGVDAEALLLTMAESLRAAIEREASKPGSPVFNLLVVNELTDRNRAGRAARVVGTAPPPPQIYVGRDTDLSRLRDALTRGQAGGQLVSAIRGWPGVGKTTTAAALAHDAKLSREYPGGVLWARLGDSGRVHPELRAWQRSLGQRPDEHEDIAQLSSRLAALLRDRQMLLVVDDVWDAADGLPFMVGGSGCATVVTTRLKSVADALASAPGQVYLLDVLDEDASVQLLNALIPALDSTFDEPLRELVRAVEGLPLALQMAGRLLAAEIGRGFPVRPLLAEITSGIRLFDEAVPQHLAGLAGESSVSLAALMQRSLTGLSPGHQLLFAYLGAFAPKPATFSFVDIQTLWSDLEPGDPGIDARHGVAVLVDRGLLEVEGEGSYQMHALVALFADSLLDVM